MPGQRNVLFITADDLNWNSVSCYGAAVADATPHIDALAASGVRFNRGHVTCAVCMPSRSVLATGRYPHNNGIEGFRGQCLKRHTPRLMELLSGAGYRCGILGKVGHSSAEWEDWDFCVDMPDLGHGRDCRRYEEELARFLAADDQRPFYAMVNSHDPHRPFYGSEQERNLWGEETVRPSKVYTPEEVTVPGFLPDLPEVRLEIAEYHSSVRRLDDTVGRVLAVLERSGHAEDTLVCFLSDNGMAFPFAKTNCYLHSTKTPWIGRVPGGAVGTVDDEHFISGIDWLPTVCQWCGIEAPAGDGSSFLGLLRGESQAGREQVFTEFNETAGRRRYPMRCVQDGRWGYIFNAWASGERRFQNESQSGRTFKAMQAAAEQDAAIAERVRLFLYRVPEELYDFANDPDALNNLIDDPGCAAERERLRGMLAEHLAASGDWAAPLLALRDQPAALDAAILAQQAMLSR